MNERAAADLMWNALSLASAEAGRKRAIALHHHMIPALYLLSLCIHPPLFFCFFSYFFTGSCIFLKITEKVVKNQNCKDFSEVKKFQPGV